VKLVETHRLLPLFAAPLAALALAACDHAPTAHAETTTAASPAASASTPHAAGHSVVRVDAGLVAEGRVKIGEAERRSPGTELVLAGDAAPAEDGEAEVGALVSGRVATLDVTEGARVKRGQVLARIDAPEVGRATAELLRARSHAMVAARKLGRQLELQAQNATSQNAVDEARAEDQAARADLVAARTLLANMGGGEPGDAGGADAGAKAVTVRVAVRTPIDGVVVRRFAVLGGAVTPEAPLFRVIAPDRLIVRARLPETAGAAVKEGAAVVIRPRAARGDATKDRCDATVEAAFGVVDEASRTTPLRVRPAAGCSWLVPGAYVDVVVSVGPGARVGDESPAVLVAAEAVVDVRGVPTVFVAGKEPGTFEARPVRPGPTAGASIVVEAGLEPGERVAVAGALLLKGELLRAELE
jgi:cobalt-zinc-cadmium efflux system membrane fusion protein